ncbi:MAG: type II secretion system F family protein [Ardenticatenaceae bacterium]|nr:type II secretion system F family protein [Ardenticatenaceae bacterium]HBY97238.1 secretion system protein F [Chloroflexota bacterium]
MNGPLLFSILVALAVMSCFFALSQFAGRRQDPVEERLQQYGFSGPGLDATAGADLLPAWRRPWPVVNRLLNGLGIGPKLALELARADLPLTAAEFALAVLGAGVLGFALGTVRLNIVVGLFVGAVFAALPLFYLRFRKRRRQRAFTEQLPDVLTLLVGGLRAGYGFSQSLQIVVERLPPPASTEFARVMRALELGLSVQQALEGMSERVGSDDLDLVVTAIKVQYELGGNLAQTLDTIGETVRERIRILREVRVMTAHQRFTAYVLAGVPVVLAVGLFILNPAYMSKLFAPGWVRLLPMAAAVLMVIGVLVMRKIVDIEV